MGVPPSEAKQLSLYEYESLLWNWNELHRIDDAPDLPDPEVALALLDRINADPRLTGPAPEKVH